MPPAVILFADEADRGTSYPSLSAATADPPASPEARITYRGVLLAECGPELARWILTASGQALLGRERSQMRRAS